LSPKTFYQVIIK